MSKKSQHIINNGLLACVYCSDKFKNNDIGKNICLNCMAVIISKIDIYPNKNYQTFIDFAYESKNRLLHGESPKLIFEYVPDGFNEWIKDNVKKTGFGLIND